MLFTFGISDDLEGHAEGFFEKELNRLENGRRARDSSACPIPKDVVNEFMDLGRMMDQDVWGVIPSYPTAMRPCSLALAAFRAALLRNGAAPVGPAFPAQAGRRRGDAPAPHERELNMI